ncbi:MAG: SPOR domain-containing protein [Flavobacteriaceae bacterium]|jgi:hypothetical protein|nr:SPOR domain-containing protein [Flavobacteriaceae bacterium]
MKFDNYIKDLLYRYECVILPNLGAFVARNTHSIIDESSNIIYPPSKIISFNAGIKENDGLLANHIAMCEDISHEKAIEKINKKIIVYKKNLNQGKELKFKNVGSLSLKDGSYIFIPSNKVNFLNSSFGLTGFSTSKINRANANKNYNVNSYVKYAAILVIALFVGSFIANNYLDEINQANMISYKTAEKEIENKIQKATFIIDNPLPAIKLRLKKQYGDFHIVAGSFRVKENSYTKLEQLKTIGYLDARKIGKNNYGLYQVAYGSYDTRAEAYNALSRIRSEHNINAWLLYKSVD